MHSYTSSTPAPDTKEKKAYAGGASPLDPSRRASQSGFNGADLWECIFPWRADAMRAYFAYLWKPVEAELQWDRIIDKPRRPAGIPAAKLTKSGFPMSPGLIACPLAATSIPSEDHDLFSVLQGTNCVNSFDLPKPLTLDTLVSNFLKPASTLTSPPSEDQPTLATTYHATNELLQAHPPPCHPLRSGVLDPPSHPPPIPGSTNMLEVTLPCFVS